MTQLLPGHHSRSSLVRAGAATRYISLDLVRAGEGAEVDLSAAQEQLVVVVDGEVSVRAGGHILGSAARGGEVFDLPGDAFYLPTALPAQIQATSGPALLAVVAAPRGASPLGDPRIIRAGEQVSAEVGARSWRRTVRTILGPQQPASRLLVGETVNPPGLWSSYPPHRHDRDSEDEAPLEEVYWFKIRPDGGFGAVLRYSADGDRQALMVADGEAAVISSGFHPVVAAPGYQLYYLWVLAGERREQRVHLDPSHSWVGERGR